MPYKCCVPLCSSGYYSTRNENNVGISFHQFPSDPSLRIKWLNRIPRKHFEPTTYSRVCSKHFYPSDFSKERKDSKRQRRQSRGELKRANLTPTAVPSIFPNHASYLTTKEKTARSSKTAATRRANDIEKYEKEVNNYFESDKINTLSCLREKLQAYLLPSGYQVINSDVQTIFIKLDYCNHIPRIVCSLTINEDLSFTASSGSSVVPFYRISDLKSPVFSSCAEVVNVLASLSCFDAKLMEDNFEKIIAALKDCSQSLTPEERMKINFLIEQLSLITVPKNQRRYSSSLLTSSFMWNAYSPAAYRQIRKDNLLTLPSPRHLERLSQKLSVDEGGKDFSYIHARVNKLNKYEKDVILLIDEIHTARKVEYSKGYFIGSVDKLPGTTLLCFMIKSLRGRYEDMVALYPVSTLNCQTLRSCFFEIMNGLSDLGLSVIAVSLDNAPSNRAFFANELCNGELRTFIEHPNHEHQPLFLLFDSCHNVKNVYNNLINRGHFIYPEFPIGGTKKKVDFDHIVKLYDLERDHVLKIAHKLNPTVLNPTSLQRTNMKLCLSVFCESTVAALRFYSTESEKPWQESAEFCELIMKLWNVLNVKTPEKGIYKRNPSMDPIFHPNNWQLRYLKQVSEWLQIWQSMKTRGLTKETFLALSQTCKAVSELVEYLLARGYRYVLTGNFQSDPIESRFGWYRQLSGGNFYVSVRQVLENEKKIRILSLLKFSGISVSDFPSSVNELEIEVQENCDFLFEMIKDFPIFYNIDYADMNVIVYVAGYISNSMVKRLKCTNCSEILHNGDCLQEPVFENIDMHDFSNFMEMINRGGLTKPSDLVFSVCVISFSLFQRLCNGTILPTFLTMKNARQIFIEIVLRKVSIDYPILIGFETDCVHSIFFLVRAMTHQFFNCMAKNLCNTLNASARTRDVTAQRKVKKLTST